MQWWPQVTLTLAALAVGSLHAEEPDVLAKQFNHAVALGDTWELWTLLTADSNMWIDGRRVASGRREVADMLGTKSEGVWSERSAPWIDRMQIRLVTPDMAVVDGVRVTTGAIILWREERVVLVLRREGGQWRIMSVHLTTQVPAISRDVSFLFRQAGGEVMSAGAIGASDKV